MKGSIASSARSLGTQYSWNGSQRYELGKILAAMKKGWWTMGSFWTSKAPKSIVRVVYLNMVQGAAVAGLTALDWGKANCRRLDALQAKHLGIMEQGKAC
eukprot:4056396-Lingulodinium_polyedra.AAC.1